MYWALFANTIMFSMTAESGVSAIVDLKPVFAVPDRIVLQRWRDIAFVTLAAAVTGCCTSRKSIS